MIRSPWLPCMRGLLPRNEVNRRPGRGCRPPTRPCLEILEDRTLLSFSPPILSDTSVGPGAVAVGHFTEDGNLDLVTANANNTVSVLLGRGDGTFQPPVNYSVGINPVRLAVGSLRGNGLVDIVVANRDPQYIGSVSILLNNGDGTFSAGGTLTTDVHPSSVALADLRNDGKLDLIVTTTDFYLTHHIDVFLGNGDGTFGPRTTISDSTWGIVGGPVDLVVADFNRDGKLDIITANNGSTVSYFQGNGDGTFQPGVSTQTDHYMLGLTAADLRGNGILDLVTAGDNGWVSILRGNGNGTFQLAQRIGFSGSTSVVAADFRGIGKPDIAVVNEEHEYWGDTITLLLNDGSGGFSETRTQTYPLSSGPGSHAQYLAVGDFNNDGRPDLAFGLAAFNWASVLLDRPDPVGLDVSASADTAVAGDQVSVTVTARLPDGTPATTYTGRVHFTSTDPVAVLPSDYTFTAADQGTHTFQVSLRRAGTQQVTITDSASAALTGHFSVLVNPADTSQFLVAGFPTPVRAGSINTFTVSARDAYGNPTISYRGTVHVSSSDPQAVLPDDHTFTADDNGTHAFAAVLETAGTQTITAADSLTPGIQGSQTVTVTPASVAALVVSGFPSPTVAGSVQTFTVAAKDAYANTVPSYRATVHFTSSDGRAMLPDDYTFTATDAGSHVFGAVLKTVGYQSLTARETGGSLAGTQDGIRVTPGAATHFVISVPDHVSADEVFQLTVTAYDAYGNVATGYLGTVGFASSDPDALVPQDYTFTADDAGTHVFRFLLHQPGEQTITVMDRLMDSLYGSVTVEVVPAG
jgi:hypothetical protein